MRKEQFIHFLYIFYAIFRILDFFNSTKKMQRNVNKSKEIIKTLKN